MSRHYTYNAIVTATPNAAQPYLIHFPEFFGSPIPSMKFGDILLQAESLLRLHVSSHLGNGIRMPMASAMHYLAERNRGCFAILKITVEV